MELATLIAEVITKKTNIVHFDISNNNLNKDDFEVISKALYDNHTMYGFHYEGNYGLTDEKMFLNEPELP